MIIFISLIVFAIVILNIARNSDTTVADEFNEFAIIFIAIYVIISSAFVAHYTISDKIVHTQINQSQWYLIPYDNQT